MILTRSDLDLLPANAKKKLEQLPNLDNALANVAEPPPSGPISEDEYKLLGFVDVWMRNFFMEDPPWDYPGKM